MPVCTRMLFGDRTLKRLGLFNLHSLIKLALTHPWFPDLLTFACRWIKSMEVISKTIKVTSLQLEVGVCDSLIITVLGVQPTLEQLVLRVWGYDGLETFLSPLVLDSDIPSY